MLHPSASVRTMKPAAGCSEVGDDSALYTCPLYYPVSQQKDTLCAVQPTTTTTTATDSIVKQRVAYLKDMCMTDERAVYQPTASMLSKMVSLGIKTVAGVSKSLSFVVGGGSSSGADHVISEWVDVSLQRKGLLSSLNGSNAGSSTATTSTGRKRPGAQGGAMTIPSITVSCETGPYAKHFYELRQNRDGDDAMSVAGSDVSLNSSIASPSHHFSAVDDREYAATHSTEMDDVTLLISDELLDSRLGDHHLSALSAPPSCASTVAPAVNVLIVPQWLERAATPEEIAVERMFAEKTKFYEEQYWVSVGEARKRAVNRMKQGDYQQPAPQTSVVPGTPPPTTILRKPSTAANSEPTPPPDAVTFSRSPSQCSNLTETSTVRAANSSRMYMRKASVPFAARPSSNASVTTTGHTRPPSISGQPPPRWNVSYKVDVAQPFRREASISSVNSSLLEMSSQTSSKGSSLLTQQQRKYHSDMRRGSIASQASSTHPSAAVNLMAKGNAVRTSPSSHIQLDPNHSISSPLQASIEALSPKPPPGDAAHFHAAMGLNFNNHSMTSVPLQQRMSGGGESILGATSSSADTVSDAAAILGNSCESNTRHPSPQPQQPLSGSSELDVSSREPTLSTASPSVSVPGPSPPALVPWTGDWSFPTVAFFGSAPLLTSSRLLAVQGQDYHTEGPSGSGEKHLQGLQQFDVSLADRGGGPALDDGVLLNSVATSKDANASDSELSWCEDNDSQHPPVVDADHVEGSVTRDSVGPLGGSPVAASPSTAPVVELTISAGTTPIERGLRQPERLTVAPYRTERDSTRSGTALQLAVPHQLDERTKESNADPIRSAAPSNVSAVAAAPSRQPPLPPPQTRPIPKKTNEKSCCIIS